MSKRRVYDAGVPHACRHVVPRCAVTRPSTRARPVLACFAPYVRPFNKFNKGGIYKVLAMLASRAISYKERWFNQNLTLHSPEPFVYFINNKDIKVRAVLPCIGGHSPYVQGLDGELELAGLP